MHLDQTTGSPVKKDPQADEKGLMKDGQHQQAIEKALERLEVPEKISFDKLPSGVYGNKDLQKGLYNLLVSMGQTNYSATISGVAPNIPDCGIKLPSTRACMRCARSQLVSRPFRPSSSCASSSNLMALSRNTRYAALLLVSSSVLGCIITRMNVTLL